MARTSPNEQQKKAIQHKAGPLLIIAGAGTGKTFVITQRIIHLLKKKIAKPSEILALTFTQKAAQEMEERVDIAMPYGYVPIEISTFHSFADRILRREASYINLDGNYKLMSTAESYLLLRQHIYDFNLEYFRPPGNPTRYIGDLLAHFSRLKDEDISVDDYDKFVSKLKRKNKSAKGKEKAELEEEVEKYSELAHAYRKYEEIKRKESKMDFGDIITEVLRLFRTRRSILKKYQEQYKFILVDEYQDTNWVQNELVYMLAADDKNITVVGDDDQSIYKFRGAAISNILQFKKHFGGGKKEKTSPKVATTVLTQNYRSYQAILDSAYTLIQHNNPDRLEKTEDIDKRLKSMRTEKNSDVVRIKVLHGEKEMDEVDLVVHNILRLVGREEESPIEEKNRVIIQKTNENNGDDTPRGISGQLQFNKFDEDRSSGRYQYRDIAILVRANAHLDEIIKALKYFKIPFQVVGPRGLYSQEEIKDIIAYLQLIEDYRVDLGLVRLLRNPIFEIEVREMIDLLQLQKQRKESLFETLEFLLNRKIGVKSVEKKAKSVLPKKPENGFKPIFSKRSVKKLNKLLDVLEKSFTQRKEGSSTSDILFTFLDLSGYLNYLLENESVENERKVQNISTFFEIIQNFERESGQTEISSFYQYINYSLEIGDNPDISHFFELSERNAVSLLTVHSSKGLEFPVVFMMNLVDQRFPTRARRDTIPIPDEMVKEVLPTGDEHLQEERRLFYVGMTRAQDYIFFSYSDYYADGKQKRRPSLYLVEAAGGEILSEVFYSRPKGVASIKYLAPQGDGFSLPEGIEEYFGRQVSYSQINTYKNCPLQYKFRYILRIPTPESATLAYGRTVHNTLKTFYELVRDHRVGMKTVIKKPGLDRLLEIYEEKWLSEGYESRKQEERQYNRGKRALTNFYKKFVKDTDDPIMLEQEFKVPDPDGKFTIRGFIDRVDRLSGEGVEVIDYKTGQFKSQKKVEDNDQLILYTLGLEEAFKKKVEKVSLLFVDELKKVTIKPDLAKRDAIMSEIKQLVEKIKASEFPPTPGPFTCKFCDYNTICRYSQGQ